MLPHYLALLHRLYDLLEADQWAVKVEDKWAVNPEYTAILADLDKMWRKLKKDSRGEVPEVVAAQRLRYQRMIGQAP